MVSVRRLLVSVLPILTAPARAIQLIPSFLAAEDDYLASSNSSFLHNVAVAAEVLEREGCIRTSLEVRPEQGGQRITRVWLESLSQRECLWRFRFTAQELIELTTILKLPPTIITANRHRASSLEALCLTCARLARSGDVYDLVMQYDRSAAGISEIVNYTVCAIDIAWAHLLAFDHNHLLSPSQLDVYAAAIRAAGAPLSTVWGFIDCTLRRIARPSRGQQAAYSGYKKFHALKYQAVVIPNGIIAHLFGPWEGRHADPFLLAESGLLEQCAQHAVQEGSDENTPLEHRYFQLFGDPAYGVGPHIISPFSGAGERTEEELEWNARMASVRIKVEHAFGVVVNTWSFLNSFWKQRVYSSPVGRYYRVAVLLTNARNCYSPNQVATAFDCPPPTIDEYFY